MTPELTHIDLDRRITELEAKLLNEMAEIKILLATTTAGHHERINSHGKELVSQDARLTNLEKRAWLTIVGAAGGTISILAALGTALFLALL